MRLVGASFEGRSNQLSGDDFAAVLPNEAGEAERKRSERAAELLERSAGKLLLPPRHALREGAAVGEPYQKLVELIVPEGMGEGGDVAFAAPPNTVLVARTPYHFVLYTTGRVDLRVVATSSVDEDAWGEVGWSIADASYHIRAQTPEGGNWVEQSSEGVMLIRLDGAVAE